MSADRIASLLDELDSERARRNEMVVELVDKGEKRSLIADAGRITAKSICVFLAQAPHLSATVDWDQQGEEHAA